MEPPAWYRRVRGLVILREAKTPFNEYYEHEPEPEDFDEDLSELAESESGRDHSCQCPSDASECDCEYDSDPDNLEESDDPFREYNSRHDETFEYPEYVEWKEMREDRKRELLEEKRRVEEIGNQQEREANDVERWESLVEAALNELRNNERRGIKAPELPARLGHFRLFSSSYIRTCDRPDLFDAHGRGSEYIDFYSMQDLNGEADEGNKGPVEGHIYFHAGLLATLKPFDAPKFASPSPVKIDVQGSDECIFVRFINESLVKVAIPRSIAYPRSPPPNTPKLLKFIGMTRRFQRDLTLREKQARRQETQGNSPKRRRL